MQVKKCVYFLVHLHLCASILAASLRLSTSSPALFSSKAFNVTHKILLHSPTALSSMPPPDPCYYRSPGSSQILKFYGYGVQIIAWLDVYKSLQSAARDALRHDSREIMGWRERQYGSANVKLLLHPGSAMTWDMWDNAIWGMAEFVTHYQFLDMDFDIVEAGGVVGTGFLTSFE